MSYAGTLIRVNRNTNINLKPKKKKQDQHALCNIFKEEREEVSLCVSLKLHQASPSIENLIKYLWSCGSRSRVSLLLKNTLTSRHATGTSRYTHFTCDDKSLTTTTTTTTTTINLIQIFSPVRFWGYEKPRTLRYSFLPPFGVFLAIYLLYSTLVLTRSIHACAVSLWACGPLKPATAIRLEHRHLCRRSPSDPFSIGARAMNDFPSLFL